MKNTIFTVPPGKHSGMHNFKRLCVCTIFALFSLTFSQAQTRFYVSNTGNDDLANPGTSSSSPWKSIARVNTEISNGNIPDNAEILFEEGGVFRGQINLSQPINDLKISSYPIGGNGPKPIILGTEEISAWASVSGENYLEADVSQKVYHLFYNDDRMTLARYPNSGYLEISQTTTNTLVKDNNLDPKASDYWKDANFRMRTSRWTWETIVVSGSEVIGGVSEISLSKAIEKAPGTLPNNRDWGYYFDNKLNLLDADNEWFYGEDPTNPGNFKLYFQSTTANPASLSLEASVYAYGILSSTKIEGLTIENLAFKRQGEHGVFIHTIPTQSNDWNDGVIVKDCDFEDQGQVGILVSGENINIEGNKVDGALGGGIHGGYKEGSGLISAMFNSQIQHNEISNIGLIQGLGISGDHGQNGVHIHPYDTDFPNNQGNIDVKHNSLTEIGYCGLSVYISNSEVMYNQIYGACVNLDDGGGIYAFSPRANNTEVAYNIVQDIRGNVEAVHSGKKNKRPAYGIYMDSGGQGTATKDFNIHHNTIVDVAKSGVFLNVNTSGHRVADNIFYNMNGDGIMLIGKDAIIENNDFVSTRAEIEAIRLIGGDTQNQTKREKFLTRASFSGNCLFNPYNPYTIVGDRELFPNTEVWSLDQFEVYMNDAAKWPLGSNEGSPFQWTELGANEFAEVEQEIGTELITNGDFANTNGWTGNGSVIGGKYVLTNGPLNSTDFSLGVANSTSYYLLTFTTSSPDHEHLEVKLNLTPNNSQEIIRPLFSQDRSFEHIFKLTDEYTNANLEFQAVDEDGNVVNTGFSIDDISLVEVEISSFDPACKTHLFTNLNANSATLASLEDPNCLGSWVDLKGNPVDLQTSSLGTYESMVLVKVSDALPPPPSGDCGNKNIVFITNNDPPTTSEQAIEARLIAQGHTVTIVEDDNSASTDADGRDLVIISGQVLDNKVLSKFEATPTPVMLLRPQLLDDMSMAATSGNTTSSSSDIDLVAPPHSIAGSLSGTVTVSQSGVKFGKINSLLPTAEAVATIANSSANCVFGYPLSPYGNGAGRRSAFFLNMTAADQLNADGWTLFDNTLCWTLDASPVNSADPEACFVDNSQGNASSCTPIQFDASCSTPSTANASILSYSWDFGDGNTATGVTPSHQYAQGGTFTISLTVTDDETKSHTSTQSISVADASSILFMVNNPNSLTQGELDLKSRLESQYCLVQIEEDDDASTVSATAANFDLVIISAWCSDAKIGTHFKNTASPVMVLGPFIYENMEMSLSNGTSNTLQTSIYI
ncbi:MAG: PKD domain-containing protein [Bacteroidota bacterium]